MPKTKYTGYELSRRWFDFCFENPEKVKPIHTALYFFAIEHCNRLGWKEKFGLPTEMTKDAIGVKSWHTYIKAFNDLIEWEFFILVERSKNQYSSNIIALSKNNEALDKAYDKALTKHASKHQRSTHQSNDSIDKHINNKTNKTIELNKELFEKFRLKYPGTKRGLETEFWYFKKHKDWKSIIESLPEIIDRQIAYRSVRKNRGEFVPEWKNLKTWIYNRCWEEEIEEVKPKSRFQE